VDSPPRAESAMARWHYRVLVCQRGADEPLVPGPETSTSTDLTALELATLRRMLANEWHVMSRTASRHAYHLAPLRGPEPEATAFNTGRPVRHICPHNTTVKGEQARMGFDVATRTQFSITGATQRTAGQRADGTGSEVTTVTTARLLAFPTPEAGHVLVDSVNDARYVILPGLAQHAFKGQFPVAYSVQLSALPKSDWRYNLSLENARPSPFTA
jgi:hypothetical protein